MVSNDGTSNEKQVIHSEQNYALDDLSQRVQDIWLKLNDQDN